jgi:hypothetical protein
MCHAASRLSRLQDKLIPRRPAQQEMGDGNDAKKVVAVSCTSAELSPTPVVPTSRQRLTASTEKRCSDAWRQVGVAQVCGIGKFIRCIRVQVRAQAYQRIRKRPAPRTAWKLGAKYDDIHWSLTPSPATGARILGTTDALVLRRLKIPSVLARTHGSGRSERQSATTRRGFGWPSSAACLNVVIFDRDDPTPTGSLDSGRGKTR